MSRWKKGLLITFTGLLFFIFFPGTYKDREVDQACVNNCYQKNYTSKSLRIDDCSFPIPDDGFSVSCVGFSKKNECSNQTSCMRWCNNTCFGLVTGTGAASDPLKAKIDYIKRIFLINK